MVYQSSGTWLGLGAPTEGPPLERGSCLPHSHLPYRRHHMSRQYNKAEKRARRERRIDRLKTKIKELKAVGKKKVKA